MIPVDLPKILIIVPCYNEESRLDGKQFVNCKHQNIHFLFADDGSSDGTRPLLTKTAAESPDTLSTFFAEKNSGKGGVIRLAYLDFIKKNPLHSYDWIGFLDADLATPIYEIGNMIKYVDTFYSLPDTHAIFASRIYRLGSKIVRNPKRHYFGRLFATIISKILKVKTYDSQCGAKLFRSGLCPLIFDEEFISSWIFDIEIILRSKGKANTFVEYPLKVWTDIEGSKVKIFNEAPRILKDIFNIWKKYIK